jgi:GNAT superfamily N-acetyltransferase
MQHSPFASQGIGRRYVADDRNRMATSSPYGGSGFVRAQTMTGNVVVIDAHRIELHDAFIRFVPRVFPNISFRRWYEYGGWDAGYRAFAIFEGNQIVASASLQRMNLIVGGKRETGWQFGAVGVLPDWRGRGLQRQLMTHVLAQIDPRDPVFLFGNDDVLEFYPMFGFRRVAEWLFSVELEVAPAPSGLRRLTLHSPEDRALLARIAAQAQPVTQRFGAEHYGGILLWYWSNFHERNFYYHAGDDAIVVAEEDVEVLRILDVVAERPIDLASYLPQLVTQPRQHVEFAFTPERYWPSATPCCEYLESPLFVLDGAPLPDGPFKFPVLAQT